MDPQLTKPINIDDLLIRKPLEPLTDEQVKRLTHVQSYDVSKFNEADVREYIISPILRVLGYDKNTPFSTSLENTLYYLGQKRRSDYQAMLWEENFWLIEAKKPDLAEEFNYDAFSQALEYSVHPKVNAVLIVLCDGVKIEIFDREVDVDKPILRVPIKNLVADFNKVRAILEPMQIWFFEKRRILRQLDRVFDKEFVMDRVEEFTDLVAKRLRSKSQQIIENFRKVQKGPEDAQMKAAENATLIELTEVFMWYDNPVPVDNRVNRRLVELSQPSSFQTMHRIFPDSPRPANESFMAQAGTYLLGLGEVRETVEWSPSWLANGPMTQVSVATLSKFYLDQCLTYFRDSEPHQLILMAANSAKRIMKILTIANDEVRNVGTEMHAVSRYYLPEMTWGQILASPEKELIGLIDQAHRNAAADIVKRCTDGNRKFKTESARHIVRGYWDMEKRMLAGIPNYGRLLKERDLGEIQMIEHAGLDYDNLAHSLLCRFPRFPKWREYLIAERKPYLLDIAAMGSWAAKEMIGLGIEDSLSDLPDQAFADRFFLGDVETFRTLRQAYKP